MADLAVQIRNRQRLVLKSLPAPATEAERRLFSLAADIAMAAYPADGIFFGEPLALYYMELARVTAAEIGLSLPAVMSALLSGISEGTDGWNKIDLLNDPSV